MDFVSLLGALGFFIYGMKVMSEGIQKVAGSKMRQILGEVIKDHGDYCDNDYRQRSATND